MSRFSKNFQRTFRACIIILGFPLLVILLLLFALFNLFNAGEEDASIDKKD